MPIQQEMFAHARVTDPDTSHEAAASASQRITDAQQAVYQVMLEIGYPITDWQLVREYDLRCYTKDPVLHQSESGIRSRRHELVVRGLVRDTGKRVQGAGNRKHTLWQAMLPAEG